VTDEYYSKLNGGMYPKTPTEWRAVDAAHKRNVAAVRELHLRQYCRDLAEFRYPRWIRRLRRIFRITVKITRGETS